MYVLPGNSVVLYDTRHVDTRGARRGAVGEWHVVGGGGHKHNLMAECGARMGVSEGVGEVEG